MNAYDRLQVLADGDYDPAPVVPTGIHALDAVLRGGIPTNKVTVVAARTSHGKTSTAVRFTVNMVLSGQRVVVIWAEDEIVEFDLRSLSVLSGTPFPTVNDAYRAKGLAPIWARVPEAKRKAWRLNCSTDRVERPSPAQIAHLMTSSGCRRAVFILDLLGEVDWGDGKKHELIGDGLRFIRSAALASQNLFIGMTQLNRDWDRRKASSENPDRVRPVLSDIENSGQIEQVARVCMIAEKVMRREGEDEVATGEYRYHVFKPAMAVATCRWHEATATPDNKESLHAVETPHWSNEPDEPGTER